MKQRPIRISIPSGKAKLVMWYGTEDEKAFVIKGMKTKPYITAYGIKYYLTPQEVKTLKALQGII